MGIEVKAEASEWDGVFHHPIFGYFVNDAKEGLAKEVKEQIRTAL